jgi:hypothetical protein
MGCLFPAASTGRRERVAAGPSSRKFNNSPLKLRARRMLKKGAEHVTLSAAKGLNMTGRAFSASS